MFIQCQHCQSTYQIDEHKIPDQNAFVRCAKCDNPIPLDIKEQSELTLKQPKKIVSCESCGTRYSIPMEKFTQDEVSVRCGKCGHVFGVGKHEEEITDTSPSQDTARSDDDMDLNSIAIPEESEIEMDTLFDNVDDAGAEGDSDDLGEDYFDVNDFSDDESEESDSESQTQEYLESVSLEAESEDEAVSLSSDDDFELDDISDDEKSKLFMDAEAKPEDDTDAFESKGAWPEIQDETAPVDDEIEEPSSFTNLDDLSEMQEGDDDDFKESLELRPVQEGGGFKRALPLIIIIIVVVACVLGAAWYFYRDRFTEMISPVQTERFTEKTKLAILEPLSGKIIENWESGKNVFVLNGKVINNYTDDTQIHWIQVQGVLYNKNGDAIAEAKAVAGKLISAEQVEDWAEGRLLSYIEEQSMIPGPNLSLTANQVEKFQIIFYDVPPNIQKLEARINQFSKAQD